MARMFQIIDQGAKRQAANPFARQGKSFTIGGTGGEEAPKRKKQKAPEGLVQRACLDYLRLRKIFTFRLNNIPAPIYGPGGVVRGLRPVALRGLPDAVSIIKGVFYGWEFKSSVGRQSDDQKHVQGLIEGAGGKYYLIKSLDELIAALPK